MAKLTVKATKVVLAPAGQPGADNFIYASVAPADNAYIQGGVQLNLSPGSILDPSALGVTGPSQVPANTPGIWNESLDGYYAEIIPTTGGLAGYKVRYWQPGGAELAAGAYPAAITAGQLIINIAYEA